MRYVFWKHPENVMWTVAKKKCSDATDDCGSQVGGPERETCWTEEHRGQNGYSFVTV